jgi:hypothetical protein
VQDARAARQRGTRGGYGEEVKKQQARKLERENRVAEGKLIERELVAAEVDNALAALARGLQVLAQSVPPDVRRDLEAMRDRFAQEVAGHAG